MKQLLYILPLFFALAVSGQEELKQFDIDGATNTFIMDINDNGEMVGYFEDGQGTHAFYHNLRSNQTLTFDMPGAAWTKATHINNKSIMAGTFTNVGISETHGFFYDINTKLLSKPTDGDMVLLSGVDYITLEGVRDDSTIVGNYRTGLNRVFYIGNPDGTTQTRFYTKNANKFPTYGHGLAKSGEVCGFIIDGAKYYGFLWTGGQNFTLVDQSGAGNIKTRFMGMNDSLVVVGDFQRTKGFIHDMGGKGRYTFEEIDLSHLGATTVQPQGVNNSFEVVGYYTDGSGNTHGFTQQPIDIRFRPQTHGWNFSNSAANMWPQSWWQQFRYSQYDPYRGPGRAFEKTWTYPSSMFPDWPLFVEVFGESYCYTNSSVPQIRQEALELWQAISGDWGGSCYGFSTSAILAYDTLKGYNNKFTYKQETDNELYKNALSDARRRVVNHMMTYQYSEQDIDFERSNRWTSANQTLEILKERMQEDGENYNLVIFNSNLQDPGGGHSLLPYKITEDENDPDIEWIWIYDSNFPGDSTRKVKVHTRLGKWYYEATLNTSGTAVEWGNNSSGMFISLASSAYLDDAIAPTNKKATVPHVLYPSASADLLIVSDQVDSTGFYQGRVVQDSTTNTFPLWRYNGKVSRPYGYHLDVGEHQVSLQHPESDTVRLYAVRDAARYAYLRTGAVGTETDEFKIDDAFEVQNPDATEKTFELKTIVPGATETTYSLGNVKLKQAEALSVSRENGELTVVNSGGTKTYDLMVTKLDNDGRSVFSTVAVPLDANSRHIIIPNKDSLKTAKVWIKLDQGNDGTVEDTLFYENTAKPEIATSRFMVMWGRPAGTDTVYVSNIGGGMLDWNITEKPDWVTVVSGAPGQNDGMLILDYENNAGTIRNGEITIGATDASNSPYKIEIVQDGEPLGIDDKDKDDGWKLFPVPASDFVYLWNASATQGLTGIDVVDMNGKVVYRTVLGPTAPLQVTKLDVAQWEPGVYMVRIADADSVVMKKVVVR
ncbi:MAG: T9SS type A sorting domain-containing protein [Bacteroidia bacterium]